MIPRILPLLCLLGCNLADAEQAAEAHQAPITASATATRVEVATLTPSAARLEIALPGEVEGSRDALLAAALGGYVEAVAVEDGEEVREGQLLVRIDGELYAAQKDQAEARLALAEGELERLGQLGDLATAAQLQQARTQVKVAKAGLRQAQAQVDRALIRAPFAGTLGGLDVEEGEYAAPGTPILRLVKLDPVVVTLSVPDRDMVALEEGMAVVVSASSRSGLYEGTISHIGAAGDLQTRAFPVEVTVPNPGGELMPGMIARVAVASTVADHAIVIPQDWVVTRLEGQGVFVDEGGVAAWRPITLGRLVRDQVIVEAGLEAGDRVVTTGHRELAEGDELLVTREGTCCTAGRATFGGEAG